MSSVSHLALEVISNVKTLNLLSLCYLSVGSTEVAVSQDDLLTTNVLNEYGGTCSPTIVYHNCQIIICSWSHALS